MQTFCRWWWWWWWWRYRCVTIAAAVLTIGGTRYFILLDCGPTESGCFLLSAFTHVSGLGSAGWTPSSRHVSPTDQLPEPFLCFALMSVACSLLGACRVWTPGFPLVGFACDEWWRAAAVRHAHHLPSHPTILFIPMSSHPILVAMPPGLICEATVSNRFDFSVDVLVVHPRASYRDVESVLDAEPCQNDQVDCISGFE